MQPFTLLIKPSGSECNLVCRYCFYRNRAPEFGQAKQRMSNDVLEKMIKDYLKLDFPAAGFAWQGGEPMLMGLDFYKTAVQLQKKHSRPEQKITNALQTNAILFDEQWCRFLHDNDFLVGISIDGPKEFHDYYRKDHSAGGSFDKVIAALEMCKKYKVEFNVLVLLNNINVEQPERLLDFFVENNIWYLQFIPCVELDSETGKIADFSITPQQYGDFLCRIFDRWAELGPDKISIRDFESILSFCLTGPNTICTYARQCSDYIVVEHTGDCFACDFFVESQWHLGNLLETSIDKLAGGAKKKNFARKKQNLTGRCLVCRHLAVCRGGCLKHRDILSGKGNSESYFCVSYKQFFDYAMPKFMQIAASFST